MCVPRRGRDRPPPVAAGAFTCLLAARLSATANPAPDAHRGAVRLPISRTQSADERRDGWAALWGKREELDLSEANLADLEAVAWDDRMCRPG
jgi:hypothetical protein